MVYISANRVELCLQCVPQQTKDFMLSCRKGIGRKVHGVDLHLSLDLNVINAGLGENIVISVTFSMTWLLVTDELSENRENFHEQQSLGRIV